MAILISTVETLKPTETLEYGSRLGTDLRAGTVVFIDGDLGVGKTVLVHGIALGLGISDWRGSPTFNIVHEYQGHLPFFHIDAYRISSDELIDLDLDRMLSAEGVIAVEWAERVRPAFHIFAPAHRVSIRVTDLNEDRRRLEIRP